MDNREALWGQNGKSQDWWFIVDYPFDETGFGPRDDEAIIQELRESEGGRWTMVCNRSDVVGQLWQTVQAVEDALASTGEEVKLSGHLCITDEGEV